MQHLDPAPSAPHSKLNPESSKASHASAQNESQTPLMKQYWELKSQAPDALLFFRMGDFYELFGDDATQASELLDITLTSRDKNKANPLPMAGVPHHSVQGYIQKLLKSGKKVAIGEQTEVDPTQKLVKREIVRVFTPAIQFEMEGAESGQHFLACIAPVPSSELPKQSSRAISTVLGQKFKRGETGYLLACLEPSTGETLLSDVMPLDLLLDEISRLPIRHLIAIQSDAVPLRSWQESGKIAKSILVETLQKNYLAKDQAEDLLKKQYQVKSLSAFFSTQTASWALGLCVLFTLRSQQKNTLAHLRTPEPLQKPKTLILGPHASEHLDLEDLFRRIDRTGTSFGRRLLRKWLAAPLKDPSEIESRQLAVQEFAAQKGLQLDSVTASLSKVADLERICGRVQAGLAQPRDTALLGKSLQTLSQVFPQLEACQSGLLVQLRSALKSLTETLHPLWNKILTLQNDEAPPTAKDGGIFKSGASAELDRLLTLNEGGQKFLVELESRERAATGIPSLKVRYNRVFGYYIEITQAHLKSAPAHYQRKQTMVGAERFFTDELKKFEEEILTASVKQKHLEAELFQGLLGEIEKQTAAIMETARLVAEWDALLSLAQLAQEPGWIFPKIDDSFQLNIRGGRHPLVEESLRGKFVPNDIHLGSDFRLTLLITGPNMGGKSTVMRQCALLVLLGQMGAPIPAQSAHWGSVSALYTRIGAQDAIAKGQSTFMVEMSELAHILRNADDRSLIILDEIGRGTSTYDGMSVAWATLEWLCNRTRARTLFATHYHELVKLAQTLPLLSNAHMAVESTPSSNKAPGELRFLYELRDGPTNESFGIHVAQMAGIPKPVVQRAWKILTELEISGKTKDDLQLSFFDLPSEEFDVSSELLEGEEAPQSPEPQADPEAHPVLAELMGLRLEELTPLGALNWIADRQRALQK